MKENLRGNEFFLADYVNYLQISILSIFILVMESTTSNFSGMHGQPAKFEAGVTMYLRTVQ